MSTHPAVTGGAWVPSQPSHPPFPRSARDALTPWDGTIRPTTPQRPPTGAAHGLHAAGGGDG